MSVDCNEPSVKGRRAYDARARRERARRNHEALLDSALSRFLRDGFAATTVESIARDVGLSEATIYKTYGGKPGLVRALCQRALAGAGPTPAEARSDALKASERDPRKLIEGWGRLSAEVAPRVAPILLLLRDAAGADAVAADLYAELDGNRLSRMTDNARTLVRGGQLRAGLRLRDVRDVLWLYSSPELFELLVRRRRWSVLRYSEFIAAAMVDALL